MKLVLKHKEIIKIFSDQLEYEALVKFIASELNLKAESLSITYMDDDKDIIIISSNEDIEILRQYFSDKEYVKIYIEGKQQKNCLSNLQQVLKEQSSLQLHQSQIVEQKEGIVSTITQRQRNTANKYFSNNGEKIKQKSNSLKVETHQDTKIKKLKFFKKDQQEQKKKQPKIVNKKPKMSTKMKNMVIQQVDQRIKMLIPCIREQILNSSRKEKINYPSIIHQGYQCKACHICPIVGYRYECPICINFTLCETCEIKVQHDHNLMKIKKIILQQKRASVLRGEIMEQNEIKKTKKMRIRQQKQQNNNQGHQRQKDNDLVPTQNTILSQMMSIFGKDKKQEYIKFILESYKNNEKMDLISMWCDKQSEIGK